MNVARMFSVLFISTILIAVLSLGSTKVHAQEKVTFVLCDVDREATGSMENWIKTVTKKLPRFSEQTGVQFSMELISVSRGNLDQKVLELLRPQGGSSEGIAGFMVIHGNLLKANAEKNVPLMILSDPRTFEKHSVKGVVNLDDAKTSDRAGMMAFAGIATTTNPMNFIDSEGAYQGRAQIPHIRYFSLSYDEVVGIANQVTGDDEENEDEDNSDQSWLDWLGEKSEKFVSVVVNAAANHADDDNEYNDYFGTFIGYEFLDDN